MHNGPIYPGSNIVRGRKKTQILLKNWCVWLLKKDFPELNRLIEKDNILVLCSSYTENNSASLQKIN